MSRFLPSILALAAATFVASGEARSGAPPSGPSAREQDARPAPEFPTRDPKLWINSAPLSIADLRGRVVLIDVWTYG